MKINTGREMEGNQVYVRTDPLDRLDVAWHRDGFNAPSSLQATSKVILAGFVKDGVAGFTIDLEGASLYRLEGGVLALLGLPGNPGEVVLGGTRFVKVKEAEHGE